MESNSAPVTIENWKIKKIGVIGPGIVGMPMAAMLANAKIKILSICVFTINAIKQ